MGATARKVFKDKNDLGGKGERKGRLAMIVMVRGGEIELVM